MWPSPHSYFQNLNLTTQKGEKLKKKKIKHMNEYNLVLR